MHDQTENVVEPKCSGKEQHCEHFLNDLFLYTEFSYILVGQVRSNIVLMTQRYLRLFSNCQYLQSGKERPTWEEVYLSLQLSILFLFYTSGILPSNYWMKPSSRYFFRSEFCWYKARHDGNHLILSCSIEGILLLKKNLKLPGETLVV